MDSRAQTQEQIELTDRAWGKESLFYLARFCLGYSELQIKPHKDVCDFAESVLIRDHTGLDLEPRGSFKTTIFSQALPIMAILRDPNVRILLDSTILQNSIDNLGVIERHFESSRVKFLYGDYVGKHWTTEEMTIKQRTRMDLKEPTIRCASVEKVQVGPHYDIIIADDLVSKENVETPDQRKRVKDHFRLLFSLLEPGGVIIVVGTRWHYEDLYGLIIEEFPEFRCRIRSAIDPAGALYFPQRISAEFLGQQKKRLRRDLYNSQYLNDPAPEDEDARFQASWFKRYETIPHEATKFSFVSIDPGGKKKGSDEWVIFWSHATDENLLYFDGYLKGNWKMAEAWQRLFEVCAIVGPISVGLETTGQQKYLLESLQDEMRKRNKFFNVIPLSHAIESKESRILSLLQPRYQCGTILHSSRMEGLEEQLRRFPKGKDDIVDAASMTAEIVAYPRKRARKVTEVGSIDELVVASIRGKLKSRPMNRILGDQW